MLFSIRFILVAASLTFSTAVYNIQCISGESEELKCSKAYDTPFENKIYDEFEEYIWNSAESVEDVFCKAKKNFLVSSDHDYWSCYIRVAQVCDSNIILKLLD